MQVFPQGQNSKENRAVIKKQNSNTTHDLNEGKRSAKLNKSIWLHMMLFDQLRFYKSHDQKM